MTVDQMLPKRQLIKCLLTKCLLTKWSVKAIG
jgi:hypothetical protein